MQFIRAAQAYAHVSLLLEQKLVDVRARQRELATLATELQGLIKTSHALDPADCTGTDICHIIATPKRAGHGM
ncbi:hypothetical protein [Arthrobacter roseus]|uniref:hypothetical protein n=1 Tax=Arthrobacter roseus TaxID=136274 RepID=UPI0019628E4F|nr:hypothetical protein [Arthrobacter roseus]MBM7849614.1 hypothetical protein [Arthrobacter roseus]